MALPTDDEYLDHLCAEFAKNPLIQRWASGAGDSKNVDLMRESGVFKGQSDEWLRQNVSHWGNPMKLMRGEFTQTLRAHALAVLQNDAESVKHIPVGILPTQDLNASAFKTPRGNPAVLLNLGFVSTNQLLIRSYVSLVSWDTDDPFCRDHSKEAFAFTIVCLASFCATGDYQFLTMAPALDCPSITPYEPFVTEGAASINIFLLLHEYGHIILGHLDNSATDRVQMLPSEDANCYSKQWEHEFAADHFAITKLIENRRGINRNQDIAFGPAMFFGFCHLSEDFAKKKKGGTTLSMTHPPAKERWARISPLLKKNRCLDELHAPIHPWFDRLAAAMRPVK